MKNEDIVKWAAVGVVALIVVPTAVSITISLGSYVYTGITNGVNKIAFNKKIKKGLKDGSIVERDGKYYEVQTVNDEA